MYDILGMFKQLFKWRANANDGDYRTSISMVKDLERLKRACDIAEDIIDISDNYITEFTTKDFKRYNKLIVKFNNLD